MINRTAIFLVVCLMLLPCLSFGQKKQTSPDDSTSFRFQKLSMQYQIREILDLIEFQGSILSAKYHLSNKSAIRIGFDLGFGDANINNDVTHNLNDSLSHYDDSAHEHSKIGLSIYYLHYFNPHENVKFYAGGGPTFSFIITNDEAAKSYPAYVDDPLYLNEFNTERSTKIIGLQSVLGTEWFFNENMSLIAEYGFLFSYSFNRKDETRSAEQPGEYSMNYKSDSFRFSSTRVKIGLSMYF